MFGSAVIDVAVGMVFVYLVLSFVVTAVQEVLETFIKLRAAHLGKGIEKLLGSEKAKEFFENALIKGISPDKWFGEGTRKPSYISSRTFAATVLDLIAKADVAVPRTVDKVRAGINGIRHEELKRSLSVLWEDGQQKLETFEKNVEDWFNDQMQRVSGWYKRKVQLITLAVALVITVGLNADSILMVKALSNSSALRASLVAQAQEMAKQPLAKSGQEGQEVGERIAILEGRIQNIQGLGLPGLAWWRGRTLGEVPPRIPGWLLTTFAMSLGAPFWFDLLKKVVSLRASGSAPDETAKAQK